MCLSLCQNSVVNLWNKTKYAYANPPNGGGGGKGGGAAGCGWFCKENFCSKFNSTDKSPKPTNFYICQMLFLIQIVL